MQNQYKKHHMEVTMYLTVLITFLPLIAANHTYNEFYEGAAALIEELTFQDFVDETSDLNHLGYEAEDEYFMEDILEVSPYRAEAIAASILLTDHPQTNGTTERSNRVRRTAIDTDSSLWFRDGDRGVPLVPYVMSEPIAESNIYRTAIEESIDHVKEVTCIVFQDISGSEDTYGQENKYVKFVRGGTCHSAVGRSEGVGEQHLTLSRTCAYPEMVTHELGHLLGLWHEHSRTDRDNNVLVLINNVRQGYEHNFGIHSPMRLMAPYDLSSMMHYSLRTFTANEERTVTPLDSDMSFLVGHKNKFSFYDIYTLNKLYNCGHYCPPDIVCQHGGFILANCTCYCPEGLQGDRCQQVITDDDCGGILEVRKKLVIKSPGFPGNYPDQKNCRWLIKSEPHKIMKIKVKHLDLEKSPLGTCRDQLELRYGHIGVNRGPVYCGQVFNQTKLTVSNLLMIRFVSNYANTGSGFKLVIYLKGKKDCDSSPCLNGGRCEDIESIGTYFCDCPGSWVGHNCELQIEDGGWSEWSEWSHCRAPCGIRARTRSCTNPPPQNGGLECEGASYESSRCGDEEICDGAFSCDFGSANWAPEWCGIEQDNTTDILDWQMHHGATASGNTGPVTGHTTGEDSDNYIYLESSFGKAYDNAGIWLPANTMGTGTKCLQFFYHMKGNSMGTLAVIRKMSETRAEVLWQRSLDQGGEWLEANVDTLFYRNIQVGFIAVRGNTYSSDIGLDDISISPSRCESDDQNIYGCFWAEKRYAVGPFSVVDGCSRLHCFCNTDGIVDCPEWQKESLCSVSSQENIDLGRSGKWQPSKRKTSPRSWKSRKQNTSGVTEANGLAPDKWPHWLKTANKRMRRRFRKKM